MPYVPAEPAPPGLTSDHLPWVMLGLWAAAHEDTTVSPSQVVFGLAVCLPGQLSQEPEMDLDNFLKQMQLTLSRSEMVNSRFNTAASQIPPAKVPTELLAVTHVLFHLECHVPPLALLYDDPYAVGPSTPSPSRWERRRRWSPLATSSHAGHPTCDFCTAT